MVVQRDKGRGPGHGTSACSASASSCDPAGPVEMQLTARIPARGSRASTQGYLMTILWSGHACPGAAPDAYSAWGTGSGAGASAGFDRRRGRERLAGGAGGSASSTGASAAACSAPLTGSAGRPASAASSAPSAPRASAPRPAAPPASRSDPAISKESSGSIMVEPRGHRLGHRRLAALAARSRRRSAAAGCSSRWPPLLAALAILALLVEAVVSCLLPLRLAEQPAVVLGMLQVALRRHPVARELRVARQHLVLVDDLLRRAAHLAIRPRALEDAVDDVAHVRAALLVVVLVAVVARLVPGTLLVRWSHAARFPPLLAVGTRDPRRRAAAIRRPDVSVHVSDPPRVTRMNSDIVAGSTGRYKHPPRK